MRDCPLGNIRSLDGKDVIVERTTTGWYLKTNVGLQAIVKGYRDGIICRAARGEDKEVVQLGIGFTTSSLCNGSKTLGV